MSSSNHFVVRRASVTPSAGAYGDHDQIGTVQTLTGALPLSKQGVVETVSIVDSANQSSAITVHFFRASPTVASSDNAALNISDAELAAKWVGKVEIAATDYQALSASSVASVTTALIVDSASSDLYIQLEAAGTPTYGASAELTVVVGMSVG